MEQKDEVLSKTDPVTEEIVKEDPKKEVEKVTTDEPKTKIPKHPGRVAAGKALQERNRKAREAKKLLALEESSNIDKTPASSREQSSTYVMPGFYLLSIAGFLVSLVGLYYKRKEYIATKAEATSRDNLIAKKEKTNLVEMD